jgi:hypothetical protein
MSRQPNRQINKLIAMNIHTETDVRIDTVKSDPILQTLIVGAIAVLVLGSIVCPTTGWIEVFQH